MLKRRVDLTARNIDRRRAEALKNILADADRRAYFEAFEIGDTAKRFLAD